ncbi:hypothetical protein ACQY0O_001599 [Thecaphora frezii]
MVAPPRKRVSSAASTPNGHGSKKTPVEVVSDEDEVKVVQQDEVDDDDDDDDDEEEEAEEYEIEAIRDHREDKSNPGYLEYLIKWKGYPEKDNTWEPEENAANSQQIIDAYWKKKPAKSQPNKFQKEIKKKPKRGSAAIHDDDDGDSADFQDATEEAEDAAPPAKKRKSSSAAAVAAQKEEDSELEEADEDERERQMKEVMDDLLRTYKKLDDWEPIVEGVETMERGDDEVLMARLAFKKDKEYSKKMKQLGLPDLAKTGPQLWVKEIVASKKCPQKVLHFYREHLRFSRPSKEVTDEAED